jgi:hypothetical protein
MANLPEDEWFGPSDESRSPGELRPPAEDEWLAGDDSPPRSTPLDLSPLANKRILVPTGVAVVFLVSLLAAFGAFSSSSPGTPAPILTTVTPPVTATTTTRAAAAVSRPTATPPTTTLKPGDSGPEVKALQQELASLGFSVGTIDGVYGPATAKEVAAFQSAHQLTPDGIVGPATLLALAP